MSLRCVAYHLILSVKTYDSTKVYESEDSTEGIIKAVLNQMPWFWGSEYYGAHSNVDIGQQVADDACFKWVWLLVR